MVSRPTGYINSIAGEIEYFDNRIYGIFFVLYLPLVGSPDGGEGLSGTTTEAELKVEYDWKLRNKPYPDL